MSTANSSENDTHTTDPRTTDGRRTRNGVGLTALVVGLLAVLGGVAAVGPDLMRDDAPAPTPPVPTAGQRRVYPSFGENSVFQVDVSKAPLQPNSDAMVKELRSQIEPNYGGVAGFNTTHYNPSLFVVDGSTPRVKVEFDDCQKKGYVPDGLFTGAKQFENVPIPKDAQPAVGTDSTMTLWSPSTDQLWEFWVMKKKGQTWSACWGGRLDHVSTSPGYFPAPFGISASGLVTTGSMVSLEDAQSGRIDHAMALNLIDVKKWDTFWYPAQRSDGVTDEPNAIPEGARLRLDPSVDVNSLDLTPTGKAIALAAQKYGFIVVDKAGAVTVIAESGLAEKATTGKDPWDAILKGTPHYEVMKNFPWDKIQVVQANYGKPGSASTP